jgi:hypothetical protein
MEALYINKCKAFIDFMLLQQQWSGITKRDVDKWINNFQWLSEDELRLVYKLLTNIIYFSEKDVTEVLKRGAFECVAYNSVLSAQKTQGFALSQKALRNIYEQELNGSCFVPLLDSGAPHESGNYVTRLLVQQGIVPQDKSMFLNSAIPLLISGKTKNLIIVDDCVGSGQQLTDFWEKKPVVNIDGVPLTLKGLCQKYGVTANYLTLFGYEKNIQRLRGEFPDLTIFCVRYLRDKHRVFSDESYIWDDTAERDKALELFKSITKDVSIPLYGYNGLDFAFIMHQTIPDWSLPAFWKENADWNLLLRRKNSND